MNRPAIIATVTIGFLFWLSPTIGTAMDETTIDGETLYGWCAQQKTSRAQDPIGQYCYGFLSGVVTGFVREKNIIGTRFCPGDHLQAEELRKVVASWLKKNIDKWDKNAHYLVETALTETFPCH